MAYLLWLLLGVVGMHRFYLAMKPTGICMACLALVNVASLVLGDDSGDELLVRSVVMGGAPMLWVLSDVFRIPRFVQNYNDQLIRRLGGDTMTYWQQETRRGRHRSR